MLANFSRQAHGNLNAVIGGFVKQKKQNLGRKHFVHHLLVTQMGDECRRRYADRLIVSLESLPELDNQPIQEEFSNLRQLGIDNCRHGSVDGRERQTCRLGFHDTPAKQTTSPDQVLAK
jgi:hypothetical protein